MTRIETVQHAVCRGDPDDRVARSLAVGEGRVCAGARERLAVEQIRIGCADIDRLRIDDIAKYGRAVAIAAAVLDFEAGVAAKIVDDVLTAGRIAAKRCLLRGGERRGGSEEHTSELQSLMRISNAEF